MRRHNIVEGEPGIFPPGFAKPWLTVWRWLARRGTPPAAEEGTEPGPGPGGRPGSGGSGDRDDRHPAPRAPGAGD